MKFDASDFEVFSNWLCMTLVQNLSYGIIIFESTMFFKLLYFLIHAQQRNLYEYFALNSDFILTYSQRNFTRLSTGLNRAGIQNYLSVVEPEHEY